MSRLTPVADPPPIHRFSRHPDRAGTALLPPRQSKYLEDLESDDTQSTLPPQSLASSEGRAASPVSTAPTSRAESNNESSTVKALGPSGAQNVGLWELHDKMDQRDIVDPYATETRAKELFSERHLLDILNDSKQSSCLHVFLQLHRPSIVPLLEYYITVRKALNLIVLSNKATAALQPVRDHDFAAQPPAATVNVALEDIATKAFETLERECLSAYVSHTFHQATSQTHREIIGALASGTEPVNDTLVEMFCLTDPNQLDNPIVFASKAFARNTQYSLTSLVGQNCRLLQGRVTHTPTVDRISAAVASSRAHSEVLLNYRQDGTPFLNLLTLLPLKDVKGKTRYFLGAQIDVSGVVDRENDACTLPRPQSKPGSYSGSPVGQAKSLRPSRSFQSDCTFNLDDEDHRVARRIDNYSTLLPPRGARERTLLQVPSMERLSVRSSIESLASAAIQDDWRAPGIFQRFLIFRPTHPFRILFTSPALQIPKMIQSPFLSHIGGDDKVRSDFWNALDKGRRVTARILWLSQADQAGERHGRSYWAHCTPLRRGNGDVGVWIALLLDEPLRTQVNG